MLSRKNMGIKKLLYLFTDHSCWRAIRCRTVKSIHVDIIKSSLFLLVPTRACLIGARFGLDRRIKFFIYENRILRRIAGAHISMRVFFSWQRRTWRCPRGGGREASRSEFYGIYPDTASGRISGAMADQGAHNYLRCRDRI